MQNNVNIHLKTKVQIIIFFIQLFTCQMWGQITDSIRVDSIPNPADSAFIVKDSLFFSLDIFSRRGGQ